MLTPQDKPRTPKDDAMMSLDEGWWASVVANEPVEETYDSTEAGKSRVAAKANAVNWKLIQKLFETDQIVTLETIGSNQGGLLVQGDGIQGFVPISHLIDIPNSDIAETERQAILNQYLGRQLRLKVIECKPALRRVVLSERAALFDEGKRKQIFKNLMIGDISEGTITNITDFGVFIDLGGVEGLIHLSELSWGRVRHPTDVVHVGQRTRALVLEVDETEGRVAMSLKQLTPNPWQIIMHKHKNGDTLKAHITHLTQYGAFAEIQEGIEGLIHISVIDLPDDTKKLDDYLAPGETVTVQILSIDPTRRRLSLKLVSKE
jgi:small subunit ribosomal protein S1